MDFRAEHRKVPFYPVLMAYGRGRLLMDVMFLREHIVVLIQEVIRQVNHLNFMLSVEIHREQRFHQVMLTTVPILLP
ncbi:hypothetical protein ED28_14565 [[Pantoea] beijingensis]|uniref:Uncharacterized protein n=1 Tax=[Pantoea] beijingensis TaxID=1324864 RepID=A0A443IBI3_9GAMM|nr:hypothetical protein ED28_14565 [[Pantoea] beijingensis]